MVSKWSPYYHQIIGASAIPPDAGLRQTVRHRSFPALVLAWNPLGVAEFRNVREDRGIFYGILGWSAINMEWYPLVMANIAMENPL
jgi:hypothetical protein